MVGELIDWAHSDYELTDSFACMPAVTLNDTNVLVIFQSAYFDAYHTFYKVGEVNQENNQIVWTTEENQKLFDDNWATELSVSMNSKGDVVAVGRRFNSDSFIFRVGSLSEGQITWKPILDSHGIKGCTPSVCINDEKHVLVVYQSTLRSLYCSYGKLSPDAGGIVWSSRHEQYDYGTWPSVAVMNDGILVEAHETNCAHKGNTLFHHTAKFGSE